MHCISVIGTGYVGLVTGACLADFGMDVICVDNNIEKIQRLQKGEIPIYENGLDMVVKRNVGTGRLRFTSNLPAAVHDAEVVFLAVGTPPLEDGSVDLAALFSAVDEIAAGMDGYKVIVTKSTVPVGTTNRIKREISAKLDARGVKTGFDMISNPEFLREGSAVYDFMHPDRVILGYNSGKALEIMKSVYRVLYLNETPFIETNIQTAEMIKYASNAFLALKITYINQIANLCEAAGANVIDVSKAMGKDARIGSKFLHPGPGYGGSCFP
ncbi:MAG: UDP-glucose/GDP-mannose dehydrogenase family protein, partial [Spirochaetaceae bacterium]